MKRHRGNLKAYYQMKEAKQKRLHTVWFQLYDIPILIFLTFHFSEFSKFNTMIIYNLCNSKSESNVFSVTILFCTLRGEFPSRVWASWNLHYHLHLHGSFLCCQIRSDNIVQILLHIGQPICSSLANTPWFSRGVPETGSPFLNIQISLVPKIPKVTFFSLKGSSCLLSQVNLAGPKPVLSFRK